MPAPCPMWSYVDENLYTCSQDTQEDQKKIEEHRLNRVVVASCSPRTHEPLFQETIREAGLNQYLFEMANIRDQCSWVHMHDPQRPRKRPRIWCAWLWPRRASPSPLRPRSADVNQALVIGGGLAGMTAALSLADQGFECTWWKRSRNWAVISAISITRSKARTSRPSTEHGRERSGPSPSIRVITGAVGRANQGFIGSFKPRFEPEGDADPRNTAS